MDQPTQPTFDLTSITAEFVSSYVANNSVHRSDLPGVIVSVYAALQGLVAPQALAPEKPGPAVSVRKSVTPDFLISLEDGRQYKTLKRHLGKVGLTPEEYRAKWGLPHDYPIVAPNYAQKRSALAISSGLGQQGRKAAAAPKEESVACPVETRKPKRRGPSKRKASE